MQAESHPPVCVWYFQEACDGMLMTGRVLLLFMAAYAFVWFKWGGWRGSHWVLKVVALNPYVMVQPCQAALSLPWSGSTIGSCLHSGRCSSPGLSQPDDVVTATWN